jgi:hypothetical protein
MPEGIPGPSTGEHVFDIDFELGQAHDAGITPFGRRRRLDIRGGAIDGAAIRGKVKNWGVDDGAIEIEQLHMLQLGEDQVFLHGCGLSATANTPARIVLDFEAPNSSTYAYLNEGVYVADRAYDEQLKLSRLRVYRVGAAADASGFRVQRARTRPPQPVACATGASRRGSELYRARVALAGYWSVGESKRGTRNMVPIVSGTLQGELSGRVLAGGADYQLDDGDMLTLDARYVLELDDGELIFVRNCGKVGALVPSFEARVDGPYAFLNEPGWSSADPAPNADLSGIDLVVYSGE